MRLAGINTGYDTEAMIEQMMSSYQTKIDNQNKKLTKLTWQQEAYRDVTDKLTKFKNKYFDILNKKSYLLSPSTFNNFKSTINGKTLGDKAKGLDVTTTTNSVEGSYKIKLTQLATATKASGKSIMPESFALDMEKAAKNSNFTENDDGTRTYSFSLDVKVGDITKTVEFKAENIALGADGNVDMAGFTSAVTSSLNASLAEAFGRTGADKDGDDVVDDYFLQVKDAGDGTLDFAVNGNASVSVTEKEGSFGLTKLAKSVAISAQSAVTGKNTVAVNIGGKVKNVTFEGVSDTYFDSRNGKGNESILNEYNALKEKAYRAEYNLSATAKIDENKLEAFTYTSAQASKDKNTAAFKEALNSSFSEDGITFSIDSGYVSAKKSGVKLEFSMTSVEGGTLGLEKGAVSNRFSAKTKLKDIGISGNSISVDGTTGEYSKNYSFTINGKKIELDENATITSLIDAVNKSGAGVTMTYSTLKNSFEITSNNMGSAEAIEFGKNDDGTDNRILKELGLLDATVTTGQNAIFDLNGTEIYHNSNSYTVDGTTFKFSEDMTAGEVYEVGVAKNYDDVKQNIKDFVTDYNQLIDDIYGHIGTAPARDEKNNLYEPLTDAQKGDMNDKEIEKWETAAKKGVIYHDSTVSSIMTQIRTALYGSVTLDDGTRFGIYNMGIKTSSILESSSEDVMRGKLKLDEDALNKAFNENPEAVAKLFTDSENGIMTKVNKVLDNAVRTTGRTKGSLINKAGTTSGSSAKDNYIYRQMESVQKRISQLQERYDAKEEYWWKVFTNLESAMGNFNNQSAYLSNYLSGFGTSN